MIVERLCRCLALIAALGLAASACSKGHMDLPDDGAAADQGGEAGGQEDSCHGCPAGRICHNGSCVPNTSAFALKEFAETVIGYRVSGYACATCSGSSNYVCPSFYGRAACQEEAAGSHGCCAGCPVARVTCLAEGATASDAFKLSEEVSSAMPDSIRGYACATCTGTDYLYACPTGYERKSCELEEKLGVHGCCESCWVILVECARTGAPTLGSYHFSEVIDANDTTRVAEGYTCGSCAGADSYICPGNASPSCQTEAQGTHGCCPTCPVAHVRCVQ